MYFVFKMLFNAGTGRAFSKISFFGKASCFSKYKNITKGFKIVISLMLLVFSLTMFYILFFSPSSANNYSLGNIEGYNDDKQKVVELVNQRVHPSKSESDEFEEGGEGLNLALIAKMNEGYCKEYLTICAKNQKGELNDYKHHMTVQGILGAAMSEQGTYPNSIIPCSGLAWVNGKVQWKDSASGVSPEENTLSGATTEVYNKGMKYYSKAFITTNGSGTYWGPFQQTASYFNNRYKPSRMNKKGKADGHYFPDQVTGLDAELEACSIAVNIDKLSQYELEMASSMEHGVGPGWRNQECIASNKEERTESLKDLYKILHNAYNKYRDKLCKLHIEDFMWKFYVSCILMEEGWSITNNAPTTSSGRQSTSFFSSNKRYVIQACKDLGICDASSVDAFLSKHTKNADRYPMSVGITGSLWTNMNGKVHYSTPETIGHNFAYMFAGVQTYGSMLKFSGVGVDPTNPSSYMGKLQKKATKGGKVGQWIPGAGSLKQHSLNPNEMTQNQMKLFLSAIKYLGVPYTQACRSFSSPMQGLDCSWYMHVIFKETFGVDIGSTTYDQPYNSNLITVNRSDLQLGDLVYSPGHVGLFGGWTDSNKSKFILWNAPSPGKVVRHEITGMDSGWFYNQCSGNFKYRRYKGM